MKKLFLSLIVVCSLLDAFSQLKVGDPGVVFDQSKMDARYPQMEKWITAGVRGGIPFLDQQSVKRTITDGADSDAIMAAINAVGSEGGGAVLLMDGDYRIDKTVSMRSNVSLIGESREGVVCTIYMTNGSGFYFGTGDKNCGLYRMTIQGSWGKPAYDWNMSIDENDELPGNDNISVKFSGSEDCWLDQVTILNSAKDPMRCNSNHTTLRDLIIDGVHKKAGGAQGYFFIQKGYNLITGCKITHLRHISLQGGGVEYNVVYDNDFHQEVSFHSGDDGNNLIENNRITLPADMPPGTSSPKPDYYAIMGAWSIQHQNSADTNYIYKNECVEYNHAGNPRPWSNPDLVYVGPRVVKPSDPSTNFPALEAILSPKGGTFYPVVLGEVEKDYVLIPSKLEAEDYESKKGSELKIENVSDVGGGKNIGFIQDGDYTTYLIDVPETANYEFEFRVASNAAGGSIALYVDEEFIGEVSVKNTSGWQSWVSVSESFVVVEGKHEFKLVYEGSSTSLFNVNWIDIKQSTITGTGNLLFDEVTCYPNPAREVVHLSKEEAWTIYSPLGILLETGFGDEINTGGYKAGIYTVVVNGEVLRVLKY